MYLQPKGGCDDPKMIWGIDQSPFGAGYTSNSGHGGMTEGSMSGGIPPPPVLSLIHI